MLDKISFLFYKGKIHEKGGSMPLADKKYSNWCDRPAQYCVNYDSCDSCPAAEPAAEYKRKALAEESKED